LSPAIRSGIAIGASESRSTWCGRSVASLWSRKGSAETIAIADKSAIEVPPGATPVSTEEAPAGVSRRYPIPSRVRRNHPIACDPRVPSANEIPGSVHPIIPRARHRRPLVGVAWNRRGRRCIVALNAVVRLVGVARVPSVLTVIVLRIAIRFVDAWVDLTGRVLLRVLLPKHGRTQSSRNRQHCHPSVRHGLFSLSRRPSLSGSCAFNLALEWPHITS